VASFAFDVHQPFQPDLIEGIDRQRVEAVGRNSDDSALLQALRNLQNQLGRWI
jgi:hypothetical protein